MDIEITIGERTYIFHSEDDIRLVKYMSENLHYNNEKIIEMVFRDGYTLEIDTFDSSSIDSANGTFRFTDGIYEIDDTINIGY